MEIAGEPRIQNIICIVCPSGCNLIVAGGNDGSKEVCKVTGNRCSRGRDYAINEATNPVRTLTSTISLDGSYQPVVSVRTSKPIPKALIIPGMSIIKAARARAPVRAGDVIIENILNTGADIIATESVDSKIN